MIEDLVKERGGEHGDFRTQFPTAQSLKQVARASKNWERMSLSQREALEMVLLNVSRILNGNPSSADHWADIAGYAYLIAADLKNREEPK
jgi:hypothetical protein